MFALGLVYVLFSCIWGGQKKRWI